MNKKIDNNEVLGMLEEGFSNAEIARRLNCSTKQVGRIKMKLEAELDRTFERDNLIKDYEIETARRELYVFMGIPYEAVGKRFGVSRQAIYKTVQGT